MKSLIIGYGEVGKAHFKVLSRAYPYNIFYKDKEPKIFDSTGYEHHPNGNPFNLLLIATRCNPSRIGEYVEMVKTYVAEYKPKIIDILTTTPCGTCDSIQDALGTAVSVNRSSIRGMHPNLDKFLLDIPKHIGGPSRKELGEYYAQAGIPCMLHEKARAVELFHVLNNFIYGVNVMAADECAGYCRETGVDYMEFLKYRETNNSGFLKAGYPSKVSPILYPSGGSIGGHCVRYAPSTIPENIKGPLAKMLESYG